jgi:predicted aminopeptidase
LLKNTNEKTNEKRGKISTIFWDFLSSNSRILISSLYHFGDTCLADRCFPHFFAVPLRGHLSRRPLFSSFLRCTTSGTLASQTAIFLISSLYHFGDTCLADRCFPHFFAVPLRGHLPRRPPFSSFLRCTTSGTLVSQTAVFLISSLYHFGDTCLADRCFPHFFAVPLRGHLSRRPLFSSFLRCTTSGTLVSQTAVFLISSLYHFGDTCLADRHFPHFFAVPLRGHLSRRPLFSSFLRCTTSGTLASQTAIFLISSLYHFGDTCLADRCFPHFFAVPLRGHLSRRPLFSSFLRCTTSGTLASQTAIFLISSLYHFGDTCLADRCFTHFFAI